MANELIQVRGTAQTVINTATDIANQAFSGAPAATYDNATDGVVPNAPWAEAMAEFPDWGAAPNAGSTVDLFMVRLNTDGTDDDSDAPSGSLPNGAQYVGSFLIASTDALQRRTIVISTIGVKQCDFYLYNGSGTNMNNDGGTSCVVKMTPLTVKPA